MEYPEVDAHGELVCVRLGSDYKRMLDAVPADHSLLIVKAPDCPAWWDGTAMSWVAKPPQPSESHKWDSTAKAWVDPRDADQIRADALARLRLRRERELAESDVLALRALEALLPPALQAYRQALRDLPAATVDPVVDVDWPVRPTAL